MTRAEFRNKVAQAMWDHWKQENPDDGRQACPREFHQLAEISICMTIEYVDGLILEQIKNRLEGLLPNDV